MFPSSAFYVIFLCLILLLIHSIGVGGQEENDEGKVEGGGGGEENAAEEGGGEEAGGDGLVEMVLRTNDPYEVFGFDRDTEFTEEELAAKRRELEGMIQQADQNPSKDEALQKLSQFHDELLRTKQQQPGGFDPAAAEAEDEQIDQNPPEGGTERRGAEEEGETGRGGAEEEKDNPEEEAKRAEEREEDGEEVRDGPGTTAGGGEQVHGRNGHQTMPNNNNNGKKQSSTGGGTHQQGHHQSQNGERGQKHPKSAHSREPPLGEKEERDNPQGRREAPESESVDEAEDKATRNDRRRGRKRKRNGRKPGDRASNCRAHLHQCVAEEFRMAMELYCRGTCAQLGRADRDFGINCRPLARDGLCSDERWGEMMDKFCHRSCTHLRGRRRR